MTDELACREAYLRRRAEMMPNYERHQARLAAGETIRDILSDVRVDDDVLEYEEGSEPHWSGFDTREEYLGLR